MAKRRPPGDEEPLLRIAARRAVRNARREVATPSSADSSRSRLPAQPGSSAWPSLPWLLHTILDAVVDEYQEIAGELEQETEDLEELEELTLESLDMPARAWMALIAPVTS